MGRCISVTFSYFEIHFEPNIKLNAIFQLSLFTGKQIMNNKEGSRKQNEHSLSEILCKSKVC